MTLLPRGTSGRDALEVALEVARMAGAIQSRHFYGEKGVRWKGWGNVVTQVDLEVERLVFSALREEFPGFGLMGEETAQDLPDTPYTWVVDPLDGTRNYAAGIPFFAFNLALLKEGEPVLGVTYDPMRDEMFTAVRGQGAHLNGRPIRVSERADLETCILALDLGYNDERALLALALAMDLWPGLQALRVIGSSALGLAYIASGRWDLYLHQTLSPWDLAPGLLLVAEAGGVVVDPQGRPAGLFQRQVLATTPTLLPRFLSATEGAPWRQTS